MSNRGFYPRWIAANAWAEAVGLGTTLVLAWLQAPEQLIRLASQDGPGVRTLKRGLIPYIAYFIAHERHHRGNILLTRKQSGHAVDKKIRDAICDWDRL